MRFLFAIRDERLLRADGDVAPAEIVWIDILAPTAEEEAEIEALLGIDIPTREEMAEIEVSSRLYRESNSLYMTASLLVDAGGPDPQALPVTFILTGSRLVTVRYSEPSVFATFVRQAERVDSNLRNADSVLVALLEAIIDRTADILEKVASDIDAISRSVLQNEAEGSSVAADYKSVLRRIARNGDLNSKLRESLVGLGRILNYLGAECGEEHPGLREHTGTMAADIRSLTDHASFVAGKTGFLLDATLGLINIEQNAIIKIVSVVSVLIMPPTLIASIYGMNFRFMPELNWLFGYPAALVAMLFAAILPFWYFKRRGWL